MWIKDLLKRIIDWFRSKFIAELPEDVKENIDENGSVKLYFYSAIKDYSVKNVVLHIGDQCKYIQAFSNDAKSPTMVEITDLTISEITADFDVVCDLDEETIHINGVKFAGEGYFIENAQIRYKITDVGVGLVPITFGVGVQRSKEKIIVPDSCIKPSK